MKAAVITFPGSNCDRDMASALAFMTGQEPARIWHKDTDIPPVDLIVLPGGFSYGDYLRCGAMSALSPIMQEVKRRAESGVTILGVCNGFQILTEAGLLDGALLRNASLNFVCEDTPVQVANADTCFSNAAKTGDTLTLPVAHHDGNYFADDETLDRLEGEGQVVFTFGHNINGAARGIAGVMNKRGNILGMMPHPERATDPVTGATDGQVFFRSLMNFLS